MKKRLHLLIVTLAILSANIATANTLPAVVAKVTGVGTYDNGAIYVFFDRAISSCNSAGRIDLGTSHVAKQQVLAIAMTAFTAGKSVKVHPGSCDGSKPKFEDIGDSYFYLTNDNP